MFSLLKVHFRSIGTSMNRRGDKTGLIDMNHEGRDNGSPFVRQWIFPMRVPRTCGVRHRYVLRHGLRILLSLSRAWCVLIRAFSPRHMRIPSLFTDKIAHSYAMAIDRYTWRLLTTNSEIREEKKTKRRKMCVVGRRMKQIFSLFSRL